MADEDLLRKYAGLVVRVGANVQPGHDVIVFAQAGGAAVPILRDEEWVLS